MNTFWALVKNDLTWGSKFSSKKFKWFFIYALAAFMIGIVQYTLFLLNRDHNEIFSFYPSYFFPVYLFVFTLTSGKIIGDEKRQDTIGWWLSLPYSRSFLLTTKIVASFFRFLRGLAAICVIFLSLFMEAYVLRPDLLTGVIIKDFFIEYFQMIALLVTFSPIAIVFGLVLRIIFVSKWKMVAPLFWICIPAGFSHIWSIFFNNGHNYEPMRDKVNLVFSNWMPQLFILMILEIILTVIIYFVSLYLLENQVEA